MTLTDPIAAADERQAALQEWLAARFGHVELTPASTDASFRRYFRFLHKARSYIVMDAPPACEDCRPFVDIAARLTAAGLHVPEILDRDPGRGFLLLGDLGRQTYLQALTGENADALFDAAIDALIRMQLHTDSAGLPIYDHALLRRELELFSDWYLGTHLEITLSATERGDLDSVYDWLIEHALAQPQVFVHRDYMPRNLMISEPNPGVLDFQDAVLGPVSYDPICLFKDAFVSWPQQRVTAWLRNYWRRGLDQGLPLPTDFATFQADLDCMGLQRHLKVIGIFARICHRDGKPAYVDDVPRFLDYIDQVIPRYRSLSPLQDLLERRVRPQLTR